MKSFSGKRIWIIGASAGIGNALARALSNEGAKLVLSARNLADLEELAGVCPGAEVLPVDLAAPESLEQAITQLSAAGKLDAVICTAALYDPARIADLDRARTQKLVQVNLLGMVEVARLCPPLLRDGGQLVLFGSVAGYFGLPGGQAYSATKAAVNNLAESLRLELAPRLDVRLVCPGFVRTRLTAKNTFKMGTDALSHHPQRTGRSRGASVGMTPVPALEFLTRAEGVRIAPAAGCACLAHRHVLSGELSLKAICAGVRTSR